MKQQPQIIQLPNIVDPRGNLSFFESPRQLPFEIARTYWVYDVSRGETHGSHPFLCDCSYKYTKNKNYKNFYLAPRSSIFNVCKIKFYSSIMDNN